jgi:hypothetical protein
MFPRVRACSCLFNCASSSSFAPAVVFSHAYCCWSSILFVLVCLPLFALFSCSQLCSSASFHAHRPCLQPALDSTTAFAITRVCDEEGRVLSVYITTLVRCIGEPIIFGRCPSLSAHESEAMLRTYLVSRKKQEREREKHVNDTWEKHTVY